MSKRKGTNVRKLSLSQLHLIKSVLFQISNFFPFFGIWPMNMLLSHGPKSNDDTVPTQVKRSMVDPKRIALAWIVATSFFGPNKLQANHQLLCHMCLFFATIGSFLKNRMVLIFFGEVNQTHSVTHDSVNQGSS